MKLSKTKKKPSPLLQQIQSPTTSGTASIVNNRLNAARDLQLIKEMNNSAKVMQQREMGEQINNSPRVQKDNVLRQAIQKQASAELAPLQQRKHTKGLPGKLKSGIETLSGYPMDDVKVHYNSSKPAQLQAYAYAQGTDIHLGPTQEKCLPHEAWHVVQQKQGRVQPTMQLKNKVSVNDNPDLEKEADLMGAKALQPTLPKASGTLLQEGTKHPVMGPIQRKIGFELQAYDSVNIHEPSGKGIKEIEEDYKLGDYEGNEFALEMDSGASEVVELEIVTKAVEETDKGREELKTQMNHIRDFTREIKSDKTLSDADPKGKIDWIGDAGSYSFKVNGSVHFHPQATVGVKFGKIGELIDELTEAPFLTGGKGIEKGENKYSRYTDVIGWSGKFDQRAFKVKWKAGYKKAKKKFEGESDELISFATILFCFAEASDPFADNKIRVRDDDYFKYFMPLLFRMGLLPFYQSLKEEEQEKLTEMLPRDVLERNIVPKNGEKVVGDIDYFVNKILKEGKDLQNIPWKEGETLSGYGESPSKFEMENETDIGYSDAKETEKKEKRKGAVIELRKLGNDVAPGQLKVFALAVFDLIRAIHDDGKE